MTSLMQILSVFFLTPKPIILVVAIVCFSSLCVKRYRDLYFATGDLIQNTTLSVCLLYITWCLLHVNATESLGPSLRFVLVAVFWSTVIKMVFNYLSIRNISKKI